MVLLLQVEEWLAIIQLVSYQRERTVSELFKDVEAGSNRKSGSNYDQTHQIAHDFKRNEKRLYYLFCLINYVLVPSHFALCTYSFYDDHKTFNHSNWVSKYKVCVLIPSLFVSIGVFVKLYKLIDASVIEDYQKTRRDMLMFFIGMFLCLLYKIFRNFDYYYFDHVDLDVTM